MGSLWGAESLCNDSPFGETAHIVSETSLYAALFSILGLLASHQLVVISCHSFSEDGGGVKKHSQTIE